VEGETAHTPFSAAMIREQPEVEIDGGLTPEAEHVLVSCLGIAAAQTEAST